MHWPHYREGLWKTLLASATQKARPATILICASDMDPRAVETTRQNAVKASVQNEIEIRQSALEQLTPPDDRGLIVFNPPYGKRLEKEQNLHVFYRDIGKILRRNFRGWTLALVCPDALAKATRLPLEKMTGFKNGGIKIHLFRALL
jgi:23S rRNA G2445 N2-methylase RlmL